MRYNARRQLAPRFQIGRFKFCRDSGAFIVATRTTTGGYIYSSWVILTTTAAPTPTPQPTPTPCPTAAPGQPGFYPITGLPPGEDEYQAVSDTVTGATGSYTLQAVTYPRAVQYSDGGNYLPPGDGRAYVRTCGACRNTLAFRNSSFIHLYRVDR